MNSMHEPNVPSASEAENAALRSQVALLVAENASLREEIKFLREGLSGKGRPGAGSVRPAAEAPPLKNPEERKERRKRSGSHFRKRDVATKEAVHAADSCPDCGRRLAGGWEHRRRQVVDIPAAPIEVTDHVFIARRCGVCDKRVLPRWDPSSVVLGRHRIGVRLTSVIVHLREACRMPVGSIRGFVKEMWGLSLAAGTIVELCHDAAEAAKATYDALEENVRRSGFCHADETGWRENGAGGELWSLSTPDVRFFHHGSRRAEVIEGLLEGYGGIVVSDFYAGYNHVGAHRQRCWVHYIRDLRELEESCPGQPDVAAWVAAVTGLCNEAKEYQGACRKAHASDKHPPGYGVFDRRRARKRFEARLQALGTQAVPSAPDRQRVLARRIENFLPEMLTFVEFHDVPSDNNAAERAIRPAVTNRKICGGTRSPKGTRTKAVLMSVMHTWKARGLPTIEECARMLADCKPPVPSAG